jgi:hypothetical protein
MMPRLAVDVLAAFGISSSRRQDSRHRWGKPWGGAAAQAAVDANEGAIDRVVLLAHMPIATPEK